MPVDVLFVSHNRLTYTKETFTALRKHTSWGDVAQLFIADDGSTDGTREWLEEQVAGWSWRENVRFCNGRFNGPVAAMNWYLDNQSVADPCSKCVDEVNPECEWCNGTGLVRVNMWAKVDNDMVVCPGWLPELMKVMRLNPGLDILGMEPFTGDPTMPTAPRDIQPAEHIGGKGLIRSRAFSQCRPVPNGRQGFSQWQWKHPDITKAWVTPDLPCFGLDQLPLEPWISLSAEYTRLGWHRAWPAYDRLATGYWDWWQPEHDPQKP